MDTSLLRRDMPAQPPSFPMETGREVASPELGLLTYGGSRRALCGEPADPMELLSTIWETPSGGRFIALDYGGKVRKHLYDLDRDGVIERESWDPDGDGVYDATRRARLPIPAFLLPEAPSHYDMARLDTLAPDSLARLDPFRRAMPGPGLLTLSDSATAAARAAVAGAAAAGPEVEGPAIDSLPTPVIRRPQPLGRPLGTPVRPDSGG